MNASAGKMGGLIWTKDVVVITTFLRLYEKAPSQLATLVRTEEDSDYVKISLNSECL